MHTKKDWRESLGAILQLRAIATAVPMMTQRRGETHSTTLRQYDRIMSRQRRLTQLCCGIAIRFVLLANSFLQYDLICPDSKLCHSDE